MKVILTKIAKATINILLSFISVVISLLLSYWIAERYFFDKLFYQKSIQHGYWIPIEGYKERVADLLELESRLKDDRGLQLHDKQPSNKFTIAVIGDSYVWGQGVRFSQTATQGLEKKLNKYRNTEVLSFAYSGDNILDYAHRYHQIMQSFDVDLYIFALVINDILLATGGERFRDGDFGNIVKICSSKFPESKLIYEYNLSNTKILSDIYNLSRF